MEEIKVFTAFSGYDSQMLALRRLSQTDGIKSTLVGWSEIDKYAIIAHDALFPGVPNYGDIAKINWNDVPNFDLFTYSFPCQDISNAGLRRGLQQDSGTRSALLWECERAITYKRPKYLLMENVKALLNKKNKTELVKWISKLEALGYRNFCKVLNSVDYGVPQSRERVFLVSIRSESATYNFPKPFELKKTLGDILEDCIGEKFFLSDKTIKSFVEYSERKQKEGCGFKFEPTDSSGIAKTLQTSGGSRITDNYIIKQVGNLIDDLNVNFKNPQRGRVYSTAGVSPTLNTCGGGGLEVKILCSINPNSRHKEFDFKQIKEIASTLRATDFKCPHWVYTHTIRKLTPREYFRLMGVDDKDIDTIQSTGISDTQQYKMAGNSIVVDVLYHIFRNLFCAIADDKKEDIQLQLF